MAVGEKGTNDEVLKKNFYDYSAMVQKLDGWMGLGWIPQGGVKYRVHLRCSISHPIPCYCYY